MADTDLRIAAEWHESYGRDVWSPGVSVSEAHSGYKEFMAPYEGRFDAVLKVAEGHIYKQIDTDLGPALGLPVLSQADKAKLTSVLEDFNTGEFVWKNAVEATELLLISTLIRAAKEEKSKRLSLTGQEWGDLTFKRKNINPNGKLDEDWLEEVSEETDPDHQNKIIGYCALKMIESGAFNEPQRLAFRGEIVTIGAK